MQNNTLSRAELDATGDVLDIHYGDVLIKYGSILDATDNTIPHIISGHESTNYDYLQDGDIIVADTAEDKTVGKTIELLNISGRKIEAGLHTVPCRPLFPFASMYLGYYMNTPHYHKQLIPLMQGIKVLSISKGNISKTEISSPQTIAEQEKISRFLYLLDQRAAAQSKIIDALKKYKRGLLKDMFPQEDATVPKLRLAGFTSDWVQHNLGDLMNVTSVKRIHQSDWTNSGVRFLRARDIVAAAKNEKVSEPLFISQEKYNEYSEISGKVKKGDLLVTGVGTIGVPMLINSDEPLYFKDGNIIWFKNENIIDGKFFYYSFVSDGIQKFILESAGTGTVGTYTIDSGRKTPVYLPVQREEQIQIGKYFSQLDALIVLHQRKLDILMQCKNGIVQQLFI